MKSGLCMYVCGVCVYSMSVVWYVCVVYKMCICVWYGIECEVEVVGVMYIFVHCVHISVWYM